MQAALGADPTQYTVALPDALNHPGTSQHLLDLRLWTGREFGLQDLLADQPLPVGMPLADAVGVVKRGQVEIRQMLDAELAR
jgi:hypothetical protein